MDKDILFKEIKTVHPNWTDEQVWTQVSIRINAEDVISETPYASPNDVDLIKTIMLRAKDWLVNKLPDIALKVAGIIQSFIDDLPNWAQTLIRKGLSWLYQIVFYK